MAPEQEAALAEKLATGTWTHDYPIMAEEAKTLGLPVRTEMPEEVYQFLSLFRGRGWNPGPALPGLTVARSMLVVVIRGQATPEDTRLCTAANESAG